MAAEEAGAPKKHKEVIMSAGFDDAVTTIIYTGRPLRVLNTPYVQDWEKNRQAEIKELTSKGIIPVEHDLEKHAEKSLEARPWLMGKVAAVSFPLNLLMNTAYWNSSSLTMCYRPRSLSRTW